MAYMLLKAVGIIEANKQFENIKETRQCIVTKFKSSQKIVECLRQSFRQGASGRLVFSQKSSSLTPLSAVSHKLTKEFWEGREETYG